MFGRKFIDWVFLSAAKSKRGNPRLGECDSPPLVDTGGRQTGRNVVKIIEEEKSACQCKWQQKKELKGIFPSQSVVPSREIRKDYFERVRSTCNQHNVEKVWKMISFNGSLNAQSGV